MKCQALTAVLCSVTCFINNVKQHFSYIITRYTTVQKFGVSKIFKCFWKNSLMLTIQLHLFNQKSNKTVYSKILLKFEYILSLLQSSESHDPSESYAASSIFFFFEEQQINFVTLKMFNIINVFTYHFDQHNASLLNKVINFFKKLTNPIKRLHEKLKFIHQIA